MIEVRGTGVLPFDSVLPKRIGRYEILGQLAAGGMAEILLARLYGPADFKRAVVIKRILRSYATNASFVRMFLDEARVVASLRHPNVAYILLSLGFLGLYFELSHPGAIFPGVVGGISLLMALYALSVLPVRFAGVALILALTTLGSTLFGEALRDAADPKLKGHGK